MMKNISNKRIMANLFIVIALVFSVTKANAKKRNYPFEALIGMSDVIVTGRIVTVTADSSYIFNITETIKGVAPREISVKMFRDWTCDVRLKKAVAGQELFLFLTKSDNTYNIINGSDGELFIVDGKLQMYNVYNYFSRQYFDEAHSPKITEVISATRNFVKCYSFSYITGASPVIKQLKTDTEVNALKNTNPFSVWLFKRLTDSPEYYKIINSVTAEFPLPAINKTVSFFIKPHIIACAWHPIAVVNCTAFARSSSKFYT